ncbi:hypothetical protein KMU_35680 [Proteus vulgaris]|uniref:hypothetical protein n=1 Tax=Proteus vulgaris TaxID=585 RepID=UPI00255587CD|nr:hypothetical protein [Proteus vulgaris]GLX65526.1 hypothetical protein KMU_35680 [Proteus vulgaris]
MLNLTEINRNAEKAFQIEIIASLMIKDPDFNLEISETLAIFALIKRLAGEIGETLFNRCNENVGEVNND